VKLKFRRLAVKDIADARNWYGEISDQLEADFRSELLVSFRAIGELPASFPVAKDHIRRALVHRFPYIVYFRSDPQHVTVLAVLHAARDPRTWQRRR